MKIRSIISLLAAAVALTASAVGPYSLQFPEFTELKVADGINVVYIPDAQKAGKVEFEATSEIASAIVFEPSASKLTIKLASRNEVYNSLPTVYVYSTFLTKLTNEGDSLVKIQGIQPVPELLLRQYNNGRIVARDIKCTRLNASILAGHGTMFITGTAGVADYNVAGSGHLQADELQAETVQASITGTGAINCYATATLSVKGISSGMVSYRGKPTVKKSFLSSVTVEPIDPAD